MKKWLWAAGIIGGIAILKRLSDGEMLSEHFSLNDMTKTDKNGYSGKIGLL